MLEVILTKVGEQSSSCKIYAFTDNARTIVIYEVRFNQRIQHLVTESVFQDSVLNLFPGDTPELSSFVQCEICGR